MDLGIRDRVCVVTGASLGIGLATTELLCAEGASVLMIARDAERLQKAAAEVSGGRVETLPLDVMDPEAGTKVLTACREKLGDPWALVNNAGTSYRRPMEELTDEDWDFQWQLNVMASMRLMRSLAPGMAERGEGRIVNVSSASGKRPSQTNPSYAVGKAAQLSLSKVYADYYAASGVLINAVAPGMVDTPLWAAGGALGDQVAESQGGGTAREIIEQLGQNIPLKRFGTPEEIAAVIAFLCSEQAAFVTGSAWSVDGGSVQGII